MSSDMRHPPFDPTSIEPSDAVLDRIATSVSDRVDRSRRRARAAFGVAASTAAILVVAGIGIGIQPAPEQVACYSSSDPGSLVSSASLQSGDGSGEERALSFCTASPLGATSRDGQGDTLSHDSPESTGAGASEPSSAESGASDSSAAESGATESGSAGAATSASAPAYLVCQRGVEYGVLTLDPGARVDPVAACAAIDMVPTP